MTVSYINRPTQVCESLSYIHKEQTLRRQIMILNSKVIFLPLHQLCLRRKRRKRQRSVEKHKEDKNNKLCWRRCFIKESVVFAACDTSTVCELQNHRPQVLRLYFIVWIQISADTSVDSLILCRETPEWQWTTFFHNTEDVCFGYFADMMCRRGISA